MENINEKNKFKNIFLLTLYYTFILSFFVNELIPHKFNVLIFMVLIPFVYSKNVFSLKHYLNLTNFSLYSLMFLQNAFLSISYRLSISIHKEFRVFITFVLSVIIASSLSGSLAK